MKTVTFRKPFTLKKDTFDSPEDFILFYLTSYPEKKDQIKLIEIDEDDLPKEIREKAYQVDAMQESELFDIR